MLRYSFGKNELFLIFNHHSHFSSNLPLVLYLVPSLFPLSSTSIFTSSLPSFPLSFTLKQFWKVKFKDCYNHKTCKAYACVSQWRLKSIRRVTTSVRHWETLLSRQVRAECLWQYGTNTRRSGRPKRCSFRVPFGSQVLRHILALYEHDVVTFWFNKGFVT
jgi:hypothetical protein